MLCCMLLCCPWESRAKMKRSFPLIRTNQRESMWNFVRNLKMMTRSRLMESCLCLECFHKNTIENYLEKQSKVT